MLETQGPKIVCIGRIYCDLVFSGVPRMPTLGSEVFADNVSLHAGGGAFNSAVTFCALGWNTALSGVLPATPFDAQILTEAQAVGLDVSLCQQAPPGTSPQVTVAMAIEGDRSFLSNKSGNAAPALDITHPACRTVRHMHIGEIRTLYEMPTLLKQARTAGWTISLDCGWDDELMQQGAVLNNLVSQVDVFLPNEIEFETLKASGLKSDAAPLTVLKQGAKGATALSDGQKLQCPAIPVHVIDATGAGDAFNGGFLACWLTGEPLGACLENGNQCGAKTVGHIGGTLGLLSRAQRLKASV